jgi:aminopeptidase
MGRAGLDTEVFPGFEKQLLSYAEVIVRCGLDLRPGQDVLLADPYEMQGVLPECATLAEAIAESARAAGARSVDTIWADAALCEAALREWPHRGWLERLEENTRRLEHAVEAGSALVFLFGAGADTGCLYPTTSSERMRRAAALCYARLVPALMRGATNWTSAAVPHSRWAERMYGDLPAADRLPSLWAAVLRACRADTVEPVEVWRERAGELRQIAGRLNDRRARIIRLRGPGTDISASLPVGHRWCTASLVTAAGSVFLPNIPTEEVFTAPIASSVEGKLRVARPVRWGGALMVGVEFEFRGGRVVRARAERGADALASLLATDPGAACLGEIAIVPGISPAGLVDRPFGHVLLDENSSTHVALGDAYSFCAEEGAAGLNRSMIHVDMPVAAECCFD